MSAAQAQMFGPDAEAETVGRTRGPRRSIYIGARMHPLTLELLREIFALQRGKEETESEQAGEILEAYVIESAPRVFGISLLEYTQRREAGQSVDLAVMFAKKSRKWPQ